MRICFDHGEVTAWDCRQCRRREIKKIVADAVAAFEEKLRHISVTAPRGKEPGEIS